MQSLLLIALVYITQHAFAVAPNDICETVNILRFQLEIHAMNLTNYNTTRTPEGGPYKRKFLKDCVTSGCIVEEDAIKKIKYEPGHPDANSLGYVEYPNIDSKSELLDFEQIFKELAARANDQPCGMTLTQFKRTSLILYSDAFIKSDFIDNRADGSVVWIRIFANGSRQSVALRDYSQS